MRAMVAHLEEAFGAEHERTYGHRAGPEEPVELVAIQLVGRACARAAACRRAWRRAAARQRRKPSRRAYFGERTAGSKRPSLRRGDLAAGRAGPLIVEEYDATCVVPPGARAELRRAAATS